MTWPVALVAIVGIVSAVVLVLSIGFLLLALRFARGTPERKPDTAVRPKYLRPEKRGGVQ